MRQACEAEGLPCDSCWAGKLPAAASDKPRRAGAAAGAAELGSGAAVSAAGAGGAAAAAVPMPLPPEQQQQLALRQQWAQHWQQKESLDAGFYLMHLLMSAVHKRVLVTHREQRMFEVAMSVLGCTLAIKLFFKPHYRRWRAPLVLLCHLVLTTARAAVVHSMASKQAVHWRASFISSNPDAPHVFLLTILAVLGGPFRLFEMLGLQQPVLLHGVVSAYYLVVHTMAVAEGARLTCNNALFFVVHQVYDGLAAVTDAVLDGLVPLPAGTSRQDTCSSCPGVALYGTLLLYGSVAVPLYVCHVLERATRRRFIKQAQLQVHQQQQQQQQAGQQQLQAEQQQDQQDLDGESEDAAFFDDAAMQRQLARVHSSVGSAAADAAGWAVHLLVLLAMLLGCWLLANAVALSLLPRVLSSQQLARWCANRPPVPYLIAAQMYG